MPFHAQALAIRSALLMAPLAAAFAAGPQAPQRAVFAGGCFWGVQAVFQHTQGVLSAVSGYAGGSLPHPGYDDVSSGRTGHAESVEVTYDPAQISYRQLLDIFFFVAHDPTELNRQGPDEGTQYRSEIFTTSETQLREAKETIDELGKRHAFSSAIVTRIGPLATFYKAEAYHQDYATLHPNNPYIRINDLPKIANLKKLYPGVFREQPVLTGQARE